jgi:hypoxanthine-guanine phosphoribosyltransferase
MLRLVTLLDRQELRTAEVSVDFRGFEVGSGTFVGYGLELRGEHGNLQDLATL